MKELIVFEQNGKLLTDSREVAELIGKDHNMLLRDIRTYCTYLGQSNFAQSDFFIESTYRNTQNKEQPCYLCTKRGCDMIANKMTGKKGTLFTAAYTTRFEKMEKFIKEGKNFGNGVPFPELVQSVEIVANSLRVNEASKVKMYHDLYTECGMPCAFLPDYVPGRVMFSATVLLAKIDAPIKTAPFNLLLQKHGFLEQKERISKSKGAKKFWCLTVKGLQYGENQINPNNARETQPMYYEDTFEDLYRIATLTH